jgi:hypothetical protein
MRGVGSFTRVGRRRLTQVRTVSSLMAIMYTMPLCIWTLMKPCFSVRAMSYLLCCYAMLLLSLLCITLCYAAGGILSSFFVRKSNPRLFT